MPNTVGIPKEDGFYCLDGNWRFTFVNRITLEFLDKRLEDMVGKEIWEEFPSLRGGSFEHACHEVLVKKTAARVELKTNQSGIYLHVVIFPAPAFGGVAVYWRDITAEKKATETLESLVEKLKQADENRIAFMNTLSHELRNPLAAISMGLTLLKRAPEGSGQAEKAVSIMERQTLQLSRLVDDLLDVTRITQKKVNLKKELLDLNEVIYHTVADFKPQFAEKDVRLDLELHPEILLLEADRARMIQAVGNLLHNALKFSNKGGWTKVSVRLDEPKKDRVLVIVQDNGLGIEPALLAELFEPFVQADASLAHSVGGLGLGLPIVKGLISLHQGSVSIDSDGVGTGTRAVISLPLPDASDVRGSQERRVADAPKIRPMQILIIEDNADLADILSELLTHLGHHAVSAADGTEGLKAAHQNLPDVVISDIGLPGMNGYEIAEAFQRDEKLRDVYLVALSGYAQPEDSERSQKAGFRHHLAKPVNLESLQAVLRDADCRKEAQ